MPFAPPVHRPHGKRKRAVAKPRLSSHARGYGSRWEKLRAVFLRQHPLCASCESEGRCTAATEVDHVIPHRGDQALFWAPGNLQPMCKPCHSRKTAREDGGFGNR